MNVYEIGFALVGFLSFVAVIPVAMFFIQDYQSVSALPVEVQFLAGLVLPATGVLFLASWVQPGG
jgi:hypothetical protein